VGWGALAIGLNDNLLYPLLVGSKLRLHPLPVFVAIVGGLSVVGASGLVLGPVTLAVAVALVDIWRRRTDYGRAADSPGAVSTLIPAPRTAQPDHAATLVAP
jgi:predicted PurR-regulated permease PerM